MLINSEEKAKIALLCIIGTSLLWNNQYLLGGGCFALLLPWSAIGQLGSWLAEPVVNWRLHRAKRAPEPVEATAQ
jgi:hypothetical protein